MTYCDYLVGTSLRKGKREVVTKDQEPSIVQMVRAQFLIGIIIPLVIGTLAAVIEFGTIHLAGFLLVLVVGLGLHISTDVYNDIYDTKQGADANIHETRNYFSGGSGILIAKPHLIKRMFLLARLGLIISFLGMVGLFFYISETLWVYAFAIYLLSAFLSKYYTAAPVKLGYRGVGEIFIWLSFGPLALALAALSQNMTPTVLFYSIMPITGWTTITVQWSGQLVDLPSDIAAGKRGMVARIGSRNATYGYMIIQSLLILNTVIVALFMVRHGWLVLFSLIPFLILLPKIWRLLRCYHAETEKLVSLTKLNSTLYGSFSLLFILGLGLTLV